MPTSPLPDNLTKVSYILPKTAKTKLERAARAAGKSMSAVITDALVAAGVFGKSKAA